MRPGRECWEMPNTTGQTSVWNFRVTIPENGQVASSQVWSTQRKGVRAQNSSGLACVLCVCVCVFVTEAKLGAGLVDPLPLFSPASVKGRIHQLLQCFLMRDVHALFLTDRMVDLQSTQTSNYNKTFKRTKKKSKLSLHELNTSPRWVMEMAQW